MYSLKAGYGLGARADRSLIDFLHNYRCQISGVLSIRHKPRDSLLGYGELLPMGQQSRDQMQCEQARGLLCATRHCYQKRLKSSSNSSSSLKGKWRRRQGTSIGRSVCDALALGKPLARVAQKGMLPKISLNKKERILRRESFPRHGYPSRLGKHADRRPGAASKLLQTSQTSDVERPRGNLEENCRASSG